MKYLPMVLAIIIFAISGLMWCDIYKNKLSDEKVWMIKKEAYRMGVIGLMKFLKDQSDNESIDIYELNNFISIDFIKNQGKIK